MDSSAFKKSGLVNTEEASFFFVFLRGVLGEGKHSTSFNILHKTAPKIGRSKVCFKVFEIENRKLTNKQVLFSRQPSIA